MVLNMEEVLKNAEQEFNERSAKYSPFAIDLGAFSTGCTGPEGEFSYFRSLIAKPRSKAALKTLKKLGAKLFEWNGESFIIGEDVEKDNHLVYNIRSPFKRSAIANTEDIETLQVLMAYAHSLVGGEVAVIGLPNNIGENYRNALRLAASELGLPHILIPETTAVWKYLGQHLGVDGPVLFVDIGDGTTDFELCHGGVTMDSGFGSVPYAGRNITLDFQKAIQHGLEKQGLGHIAKTVTEYEARKIKEQFATLIKPEGDEGVVATINRVGATYPVHLGREVIYGSPQGALEKILYAVRDMLTNFSAPPELIVFTGGGSQIKGLEDAIDNEFGKLGIQQPKVLVVQDDRKIITVRGMALYGMDSNANDWQHPVKDIEYT